MGYCTTARKHRHCRLLEICDAVGLSGCPKTRLRAPLAPRLRVHALVKGEKWKELYSLPTGLTVRKMPDGVRISIPGFPPEGTRICVVDFVTVKARATRVHQDRAYDYEKARPRFASSPSVDSWKLLPLNALLPSLTDHHRF
jgi:hypothetical protein